LALELVDLVKAFPGADAAHPAVDRVSLTIERGSFVSLIGSSGCGKTTTLRMIAGLEYPDGGRILHDGRDVTLVPTSERGMRMMFQDYALFPHMTVGENVAFGLRLRRQHGRYTSGEIDRLVDEHLERVHLPGLRGRKPAELSGGQRQRVALARALITDPEVLLFDEPLGALDAGLRRAMQFELKRLHAELGKTFVYVTHDQHEALAMSDRIAVMHAGRVLQYATPEEIYFAPRTRYVARFVGSANLLDGVLVDADRRMGRVRLANGSVIEGSVVAGETPTGTSVAAVIRADRIAIAPPGGADAVRGTVQERLFLGTHDEFLVRLDGLDADVSVHRPTGTGGAIAVGDPVGLAWAPENVRVLSE
jgi:ABC-type Fe3+/spermidine/putrescine transport system ATPase subunit